MHSKTVAPLLAIETGTNSNLSYINPLSLSISLLLSRFFQCTIFFRRDSGVYIRNLLFSLRIMAVLVAK